MENYILELPSTEGLSRVIYFASEFAQNQKVHLKLWNPRCLPGNGSGEIGEAENEKVYLKLRTVSRIHKGRKWIQGLSIEHKRRNCN